MKTYRLAGALAVAGLAALTFSEPAKAITATLNLNDTSTIPNFTNAPQIPAASSGQIDFPTGNFFVLGTMVARSPWEGTAFENTLQYTSVRNGSATYNISGTSLSLFWGSPDSYNTLTFFTGANGSGSAFSVTGSILLGPQATGHHLVQFLTDQVFNSVTLSSTSPAFEFSNMVTPIPAALPLFATGLGMMGWLARRRKRNTVSVIGA